MVADFVVPSPQQIKDDIEHLKDWISKQPHLPKVDDDEWLESHLYHNKFSLEKTKFKLENYYSFRSKYPEILKNRDPTGSDMLQIKRAVFMGLSHKLTKDGCFILHLKYKQNVSDFDVVFYSKRLFMMLDMLLLEKEYREAKLITVTDCENLKPQHLLKLTAGLGKLAQIFNDSYPLRYKAVIMVNAPSYIDKIIDLMKLYFPKKMNDRLQCHSGPDPGKILLKHIDEDVLLSTYGGKGPSLEELEVELQKKLESHRKWFEEQESVCSNEELRLKDDKQLEELKGSFRKLEVD